jgi:hypothetical protein
MRIEFYCENLKGRDHLGDLVVDGRIILKYMLNTQGARVWAGSFWLRIGRSCGFLTRRRIS